jgi:hypothetical protein
MRRTLYAAALIGAVGVFSPPAHAENPSIGECLSATEAATKLKSQHKLKASRAQLLVCSSASCPGEIRQECAKKIEEVNSAIPSIVFAVKNQAGKDVIAVKVTVDGQVVAERLDGSAIPIDPGAHDVTIEAEGQPPVNESLVVHEGEKDRRENITVGTPAKEATGPSTGGGTTTPPPGTGGEKPPEEGSGNGLRIAGLVTAGVGAVGLVLGGVFGGMASSAWSSAKNECGKGAPLSACTNPQALKDHDAAVTDATISTVGFIAGGVLAAGGLTLFFIAPKGNSSPSVGLSPAPNGLLVSGRF